MANLDLNELAKRPEYAAAVSSDAEKDADAERQMRLVRFYVMLALTVLALIICTGVYLEWLPAGGGQRNWAREVLMVLFPAAAAYAIGRQQGASREP